MIDDAAEAALVDGLVPTNIADHFIGASDLATEGTFLTVLDQPLSYTMFAAGEPEGGTGDNCLIMDSSRELHDTDCTSNGNGDDYVCEYDGIAPVPAAWGQ